MPQHVPGQVCRLIQVGMMFAAAKATQGAELDEHLANGGELAKGWRPVLIALGTMAVLLGIVIALVV